MSPLSEVHKHRLLFKYGLPEERLKSLEETGVVCSLLPDEVRDQLGRTDIDSSGILFRYPGNGAFSIRLDDPPKDKNGRENKYLHPKGEPNHLFNPGVDLLQAPEVWIVEGEAKALCGFAYGLPMVGLSGIWNWRTEGEDAELLALGEKLTDKEALLPELAQVLWDGKRVALLYDSDLIPGHKAYSAYERLAEQLYRLGAQEVKILSIPPVVQGQKTGLDEFILARGHDQALQDLQAIKDRKEPYLPIKDGALTYAERLINSEDLEDKLNATVAYLGAKGKVFALDWLKTHSLKGDTKTALLQEAKEKLFKVQSRPIATSNLQNTCGLGSEYDTVKGLLKDYSEKYVLGPQGELSHIACLDLPGKDGEKVITLVLQPLCNFAAWPVCEILKDNGIIQERFVEIKGLLHGGRPLKTLLVPIKDFEDLNWVLSGWGIRASIEPYQKGFDPKDLLRHSLQLMAQGDLPETIVYTHLGWRRIGDSWVYLHAGGAVGSDVVKVELNDRLKNYALPEKAGDLKEALKHSLFLLEIGPKKITYPLLSLVYLAPLCEPLKSARIEPSHVTYLWGTSGSFKSSIIALFLSHYGNFDPKGLPASFRDTAFSIEEMAFLAKDVPLVVDDLYPSKDPKERVRLEKVLEYLSRNQGDRQGRGRLHSNQELKTGHPPRGLIIASGEYQPLSGSSLARNFALHILKEDINQEKLTQAQASQALLSQAMRGYLEWLSPQLDSLQSHFSEDFELLRREAQREAQTRTRHRRLDETVAFLYLGFNLFVNYVVELEVLTKEEAVKLLQEAWKSLNQMADELSTMAEREEPTKRFFEAILELQAMNKVYFADLNESPEILGEPLGTVRIGWGPDERGVYYILPGSAWEVVTRYLRSQEEPLSISKSNLLDSLEQKNLFDRPKKG